MDPFLKPASRIKPLLWGLLVILLLVGAGYFLARYQDRKIENEVERSSIDQLVVALRENRNRLEVHRLSGTVTTNREVRGGPGDILKGTLKVRQPWSVSYFVDMAELGLDDYAWDERSRTLTVRAPLASPDAPNIDESRQVVAQDGFIITRSMQNQLRTNVSRGARQQAATEARKRENVAAATDAAREAIARNLQQPLAAAGLGNVRIVVRAPTEGSTGSERWDVSRSIEEVLAERRSR